MTANQNSGKKLSKEDKQKLLNSLSELDDNIETLVDSIKHISSMAKKLQSSPLSDKCVGLLLSHATGESQRTVMKVLDALSHLDTLYLKKPSK